METLTAALTGILLAAFFGYLAFSYRVRGRREAGSLLLELPRPGTLLGRMLFIVASVLVVLGVAGWLAHVVLKHEINILASKGAAFLPHLLKQLTQIQAVTSTGPIVAFFGFLVIVGLIFGALLWTRNFQLRELGIVLPDGLFHFCPWQYVADCRWLDAKSTLLIEIPEGTYRVRVAADHIDAVNGILTPRVELRDQDARVLNAIAASEKESPRKTIAMANRSIKFSLTTLLLFMVVAGSACAWLVAHIEEREQAALRELRSFTTGTVMDGESVRAIELESWMEFIPGYHMVTDHWIEDRHIPHVTAFSRLERLTIRSQRLTDEGLRRLGTPRHLTELNLECLSVTDDGVEHLATMQNIESLSLSKCKITDAGLKHLGSMQQLRSLHFSSDRVTDAGLRHLESLSQLEMLRFKADRVTSVGLKRLRAALPNTEVQRYR